MSPKELLWVLFEEVVSPKLRELGFSPVASAFSFKRSRGDFVQLISINLGRQNTQDNIHFWSAFNVKSPKYARWLKKQGREAVGVYVGGCPHWNIPTWRIPGDSATSYYISGDAMRCSVVEDWLGRCLISGLPYLDQLSSWEGAAQDLVRRKWHWNEAADFYLIAGQVDRAAETLATGVELLESKNLSWAESDHPTIRRKAASAEPRKRH